MLDRTELMSFDTNCWGMAQWNRSHKHTHMNSINQIKTHNIKGNKLTRWQWVQRHKNLRGSANPMPMFTPKDKHFYYEKKNSTRMSLCSYSIKIKSRERQFFSLPTLKLKSLQISYVASQSIKKKGLHMLLNILRIEWV